MVELIPTRIQGLDEIIGGGLPKGSCILLLTDPMIEVRLFLLEYIYRGIENGEPGLVITLDASANKLKEIALDYKWFFEEKGEKKGILQWVDAYTPRAGRKIETTDAVNLIPDLRSVSDFFVQTLRAQRDICKKGKKNYYKITFESLSTIVMHMDEIKTVYKFLERFIPRLRENNCIGFFRLIKGMHSREIEETMRHMMDGTIELDENLNLKILNMPIFIGKKNARMYFWEKEGRFKVEKVR